MTQQGSVAVATNIKWPRPPINRQILTPHLLKAMGPNRLNTLAKKNLVPTSMNPSEPSPTSASTTLARFIALL